MATAETATRSGPGETRSVRMFDVYTAASYLGVSPASVQRWAKAGKLKGSRDRLHPGSPWRFTQADLDAFKAEMTA